VVDKFHQLAATVIDAQRAGAIERAALGLEGLDDARELLSLLAAPVGSAFERKV
jgi:hypothetical protein